MKHKHFQYQQNNVSITQCLNAGIVKKSKKFEMKNKTKQKFISTLFTFVKYSMTWNYFERYESCTQHKHSEFGETNTHPYKREYTLSKV